MRSITGIFFIILLAYFSSCEGPVGPVGPKGDKGEPGEDGVNILGSVYEIVGDFTAENDYSIFSEFPDNIEVYESDIVLVYILWEQIDDGQTDVWRLLPQTGVFDEGVLQYNFDYTMTDVLIFMEGTLPPELYQPSETDDQVFRIAILPADFVTKKSLDISDMNDVMNSLQIKPSTIQKSELINK